MADITLFELHLDGGIQLGSGADSTESEPSTPEPTADDGGTSRLLPIMGVIVLLAVVAIVGKKVREGDVEESLP